MSLLITRHQPHEAESNTILGTVDGSALVDTHVSGNNATGTVDMATVLGPARRLTAGIGPAVLRLTATPGPVEAG